MSKVMQNLIVLLKPSKDTYDHSLKAGNMILNRFCIDEDAAFELSGVKYLDEPGNFYTDKGKEYSFLPSCFILRNLIFMNNS